MWNRWISLNKFLELDNVESQMNLSPWSWKVQVTTWRSVIFYDIERTIVSWSQLSKNGLIVLHWWEATLVSTMSPWNSKWLWCLFDCCWYCSWTLVIWSLIWRRISFISWTSWCPRATLCWRIRWHVQEVCVDKLLEKESYQWLNDKSYYRQSLPMVSTLCKMLVKIVYNVGTFLQESPFQSDCPFEDDKVNWIISWCQERCPKMPSKLWILIRDNWIW